MPLINSTLSLPKSHMTSDIQELWKGNMSDGVITAVSQNKEHLVSQGVHVCMSCGVKQIHVGEGCFKCPRCGNKSCGE